MNRTDSADVDRGANQVLVASFWVPRTRMHFDELVDALQQYVHFGAHSVAVKYSYVEWSWTGTRPFLPGRTATGRYWVDGYFEVRFELESGREVKTYADAELTALVRRSRELFLAIAQMWGALHADVMRGIIRVGESVIWSISPHSTEVLLNVHRADKSRTVRCAVRDIHELAFAEACRDYLYSTTVRFRELMAELNSLRQESVSRSVQEAEEISVSASLRLEEIRGIQNRLEIARQVLQRRVESTAKTRSHRRRDLEDLCLVSDHLYCVWGRASEGFEWILAHLQLRVSTAERAGTRALAVIVFAVTMVTLWFDITAFGATTTSLPNTVVRLAVIGGAILGSLALSIVIYGFGLRVYEAIGRRYAAFRPR